MELTEEKMAELVRGILKPSADEFDRRLKELTEKNRAFEQWQEKSSKDFDKRMKLIDKKREKSADEFDKRMKELSHQIFGIGNSNGLFAEEFFFKSLQKNMTIGDKTFQFIDTNLSRYDKKSKRKGQFDIILTNSDTIVVVEVKYKLTRDYVNDFYHKTLKNFVFLFPGYSNYKLYGAVASLSDHDNARELAKEYGLFVLGQAGDDIEVINDEVKMFEGLYKLNTHS